MDEDIKKNLEAMMRQLSWYIEDIDVYSPHFAPSVQAYASCATALAQMQVADTVTNGKISLLEGENIVSALQSIAQK